MCDVVTMMYVLIMWLHLPRCGSCVSFSAVPHWRIKAKADRDEVKGSKIS